MREHHHPLPAFPADEAPSKGQLDCLRTMAELADEQIAEAERVFATRDVEGARRLGQHDLGINERNRRCFDLAVRERTERAQREVALMLAMMARAIERIGDNAVDIGRQAGFVATGRLERSASAAADGSPHRRRSRARSGDGLGYIDAMTETRKPDPTDPADPGTDDAPKPKSDESFLEPGDADADETAGSEGANRPSQAGVPPPPD